VHLILVDLHHEHLMLVHEHLVLLLILLRYSWLSSYKRLLHHLLWLIERTLSMSLRSDSIALEEHSLLWSKLKLLVLLQNGSSLRVDQHLLACSWKV
jgi:hypothetical protein